MLIFSKLIFIVFLIILLNTPIALADTLAKRLQQFPAWQGKPSVQVVNHGDLVYPDWIAGTWQVTSILVEQVAPLAPDIVTPGFEGNIRYVDQPVTFQVRFKGTAVSVWDRLPIPTLITGKLPVVADRSFNGLNIAQAYLGDANVLSVVVDPSNRNRQVTFLPEDKQLISTVTGRQSEKPTPEEFIVTEITQQVFQSQSQIYFNEVETTTDYKQIEKGKIEASQITAIYLSPQDPDYFTALGRPVALYRYRLVLDLLK